MLFRLPQHSPVDTRSWRSAAPSQRDPGIKAVVSFRPEVPTSEGEEESAAAVGMQPRLASGTSPALSLWALSVPLAPELAEITFLSHYVLSKGFFYGK